MKKRILIINPSQYGYSAGYFYYVKYLKQYFEIDYICYDRGWDKLNSQGINIFYKKFEKNKYTRLLKFIYSVIKLTRINKYHCIFTVNFKLVFLVGLFCSAEKKILDIRTGSLSDNKFIRLIINKIIFFNSLFFNKITILSKSLENELGLQSAKTTILPLGSDILDSSNKTFDKINLIYVGTLHKRNIEETIFGLAKFYDNYSQNISIKYDIVGFGTLKDENDIIKIIRSLKMNDIITFHGRQPHSTIRGLFEKSNIGVAFVPSKDYYQIQPSTKIFEYGLSGLFSIATDTLENCKIIKKSNGYIIKDNRKSFYEGLVKFYSNRDKFNSNEIRDSFMNYRWSEIVENILMHLIK